MPNNFVYQTMGFWHQKRNKWVLTANPTSLKCNGIFGVDSDDFVPKFIDFNSRNAIIIENNSGTKGNRQTKPKTASRPFDSLLNRTGFLMFLKYQNHEIHEFDPGLLVVAIKIGGLVSLWKIKTIFDIWTQDTTNKISQKLTRQGGWTSVSQMSLALLDINEDG